MAYALNADGGSTKIVLSSTGTYYRPKHKPTFSLSKPILQDERVSSLLSVESVFMKHPSVINHTYLNGTLSFDNNVTNVKGEDFEIETNPSVYFSNTEPIILEYTFHKVLFAILKLLRSNSDHLESINIEWFDGEHGQTFYDHLDAAQTVFDFTLYHDQVSTALYQ